MISDLLNIFIWWFWLFLIGLIFLPLTTIIFKNFFDKGYAFSKIIGLAFTSYLVWLLSSLKILPFSQFNIIFVLIIVLIADLACLPFFKKHYLQNIQGKVGKLLLIFLFEEFLFFIGLLTWSLVRGFEPSINGLEKFMDYGFVNSILKTKYFPPLDLWLSGEKNYINYYYFGHFVAAFLTKLSGIPSEITYNLRLADILGLSYAATFSLTGNLIYSLTKQIENKFSKLYIIFGGLLGATLLNFGGNLHAIIYVVKNGIDKYWYPDATRYIPYTIHEFPMYSYVVADLHGHLSDIPFVLLALALIFLLFNIAKNSPDHITLLAQKKFSLIKKAVFPHSLLLLLSFILAINSMTNFWDLPIYLMLSGLVFLYWSFQKSGFTFKMIFQTAIPCVFLLVFYYLFSLPFGLNFTNFSKGLDIVQSHSPFYMLLVLWGYFYFFAVSLLLFLFWPEIKNFLKPESFIKNLSRLFNVQVNIIKDQGLRIKNQLYDVDVFVLIVVFLCSFLIIFPEVLYVKDIYIQEYHRANTMFKLVYQSFMMLSILAAYALIRIKISQRQKTPFYYIFYFLSFVLIFSVLIYPYFAVKGYYGNLKNYAGLDGIKYLESKYPNDYRAIVWLKNNIKDQPTILEAVGESYTDYSRVSAYTGIPTVLGWPVHEWLWRGSYDEAGKRTTDVQTMYTAKDLKVVKKLLKNYGVDYIFLGDLEREKYSGIKESNFAKIGKIVFQKGQTKIYKINL